MKDINLSESHKKAIIDAAVIGMGDDTTLRLEGLCDSNPIHSMKWSCFNTRLSDTLTKLGYVCRVTDVSRNLWSILSVFHPDTKTILHFMREKRLDQLIKDFKSGKSQRHYLISYIQTLNPKVAPPLTLSDFGFDGMPVNDFDFIRENQEEKTKTMLGDLMLNKEDVACEAVVCFHVSNGMFKNVEFRIYNTNLELHYSENWASLITPLDSTYPENADDYSHKANHPAPNIQLSKRGLSLSKHKVLDSSDIINSENEGSSAS